METVRAVPSMTMLVGVEARKIVDTRSGRWLMVLIAGLTLLVLSVAAFAPTADARSSSVNSLMGLGSVVQLALFPIMAILATTSEFAQRTALVTFVLEPRRHRVIVAKVVAATAWAFAGLVVALVVAFGAHIAAAVLARRSPSLAVDMSVVAGFALAQAFAVWQGVAFGLLVSSPALAIATYLLLPSVLSFVAGFVPGWGRIAPWLDSGSAGEALLNGDMTSSDWAHLLTSTLVWVALPLAVGTLRLVRREFS